MRAALVVIALAPFCLAVDNPAALGERILGEAVAVLRVHDPRWLDKEASRFAAALGQDPSPLRAIIARGLFCSRSLDGIDLTRPALLAWRPGVAPLVAVVPILNRRIFIEQFGASTDAPLIRIGEREGTVVYSQNSAAGLAEYRLMVGDNNVAYLARSAAECRSLALLSLTQAVADAPLAFTAKGSWLAQYDPTKTPGAATEPLALSGVPAALDNLRQLIGGLLPQIQELGLELRPESDEAMRLSLRVQPVVDSLLGVWIANQRNQPNRLLPLVRTPQSMLTIAGQVAWQGQGERFGAAIGGLIKARSGPAWSDNVDEAWNNLWSLSDRNGPFAAALDMQIEAPPKGMGLEWRSLVEQRRAAEVVTFTNTVVSALAGTPGEAVNLAGAQGFRWAQAASGIPGATMTLVATDRHVIEAHSTIRNADLAAAELAQKSLGNAAPDQTTAILSTRLDAAPLARGLASAQGKPSDTVVQATVLSLALRTGKAGELKCDIDLPHMRLAALARDSGLITPEGPARK